MGTSSDQAAKMKRNLLMRIVCILSGALAAPQNDLLQSIGGLIGGAGGIRNILNNPVIQGRILSNNLNPCDGVPPSTCQCTNGESIPFSIEYRNNPCSGSARPDQCTCPNGNSFQIKDLADNVINQYNLPSCGRGVEPSFCTCRDGSTFQPQSVTGPPSWWREDVVGDTHPPSHLAHGGNRPLTTQLDFYRHEPFPSPLTNDLPLVNEY
eukprot:TRINITY_DN4619_c0_g1_i1.p1 TRINITY_DN4619_c0_g1~~TRINITY_DN4619_c0_g1_i1.p1  ORF type:complete len:235 (-),score=50.82 TRINITY_DN4619_c0_g1_i1:97-723(-)